MVAPLAGLVVLIVTLAVFVVVGLRAHRPDGDLERFVVARNSSDGLTLGLSFLAAGMGAWALFAPPEVGAGLGLVAVAGYAVGAAAPLAVFWVLGRRLRAVVPAGHSLLEFVGLRFGAAFAGLVALVSIAYMLLFVTAELTAAAAVGQLLAGLDARLTVLSIAGATLLYTTVGGLPSSLRTDRFQAWLILGLLAAGAIAVVATLDTGTLDWSGSSLGLNAAGVEVAATLILAVTAANVFHQGYWQRVWAARDDRALGRGAVLGMVTTVPVVLLVGGAGIVAAASGLDLGTPPAPLFALVSGLPAVAVLGVLVLALALVASSVDTLETGLGSLVTGLARQAALPAARGTVVVMMVPAVLVALQGYSVLRLFLIADLLCAAVAVPALLGLWPRATAAGAVSGVLAGLAGAVLPGLVSTGSLSEGLALASFAAGLATLPPFAGAVVASSLVAVVVSLAERQVTDLQRLGASVAPLQAGTTRG